MRRKLLGLGVNALVWPLLLSVWNARWVERAVWNSVQEANSLPWCEPVRSSGLVLEPVNAWSNLGFWLVGHGLCAAAVLDQRLDKAQPTPLQTLTLGCVTCVFACASFLFHVCRCETGSVLDTTAMFMVLTWFVWLCLATGLREPVWQLGYGWISTLWLSWRLSTLYSLLARDIAISLLFAVGLVLIQRATRHWQRARWLWCALVLLVVGASLSHRLDAHGHCYPRWNNHAVWHLLCALAILGSWGLLRAAQDRRFPLASWQGLLRNPVYAPLQSKQTQLCDDLPDLPEPTVVICTED